MGHVTAISRIDRALALACVLACAAALGGCGGVELQGKVFDYMGVSGDRQEPDVRMSERPPLLLPPNLQNLPQPGTGPAVAAARPDWPDDPEVVRQRIAKEDKAKEAEITAAADPTNPYAGKPTLLDRWFKSDKEETAAVDDVPEPDPSDRVTDNSAVAQSQPKGLTPHVPQAPLPEQPKTGPDVSGAYEGMSNPSGNSAGW